MNRLTPGRPISHNELTQFVAEALHDFGRSAEHVLVVIPDDTRTVPMPAIFDALCEHVAPRVGQLTILIALGTHPPMTEAELTAHLGEAWREQPGVGVVQHEWQSPEALRLVGTIEAAELEELSGGRLAEEIPVRINRLALEADRILIVNPVFPHEVVGFSGGHKYFFPGIAGSEILDVSHWLGALITNPKVNGHKDTPVRTLIERAAAKVPTPRTGLAIVMRGRDAVGLFVDDVHEAWSAAAELSAETNIQWTDRAFHTVISVAPPMYRELWTAGKCMYKLEPVVANGGTLIIFAPHLDQISPTHGRWIEKVGYHTRDYFLANMSRFSDVPRAILAHSTHVKGIGLFKDGMETPRVDVVLATRIPEATCQAIHLGYQDVRALDVTEYEGREEEGVLVVPNAGEMLFRLSDGTVPDVDAL